MSQHLTALGFPVSTEQDFRHYVYQATEFGETFISGHGSYTCWKPGYGIELWVQTNSHHRLLGMNPHFRGTARTRVRITERIPHYHSSILEGAFYAWACPQEANGAAHSELFPFVFDLPDYDCYETFPIPSVVPVQLSAFAYYLQSCVDGKSYTDAQKVMHSPSTLSFTPTGLFTPDGRTRHPALAQARFNGYVIATQMMTNPVTWQKFYSARVHTLIGEIDIVADPQVVQGRLAPGCIIQGDFWLSGRLL